jgi:hypothetical protein
MGAFWKKRKRSALQVARAVLPSDLSREHKGRFRLCVMTFGVFKTIWQEEAGS